MRAIWRSWLYVVFMGVWVIVVGCFPSDPRTSNQGGGDIFSAISKFSGGNIGDLTADEWQILGDAAVNLGNAPIPYLTDDQAAAIVEFLDINNIQTIDQLNQAAQSGDLQIPEGLTDLII